jgi:FKBP-type peptidyl-prolyl cis-trans isomerase
MLNRFTRTLLPAAVLLLAVLGIARASLDKYEAKRQAIYEEAKAQQQRLGITNRATLASQYPTPEITLGNVTCVAPGATVQLVVKGKFQPGTKFLLKSEHLEPVNETVTPTEYRAAVNVPATGIGPEEADLEAYTPVSGARQGVTRAVIVTGRFEWDMNVSNGWRVIARLVEDTRCGRPDGNGQMKYSMEFYKGAETTPFEKRTATLYYSSYNRQPYRFSIDEDTATTSSQNEMEELAKKIQGGNLTSAQMEKLMARMEELQKKMMAEMTKRADPAYQKQLEEKKAQFGCRTIELQVLPENHLEGRMSCSEKVGSDLKITGTLKYLGR